MPRIGYRLAAGLLALATLAGAGEPPTVLRRGVNLTNWFRFPLSRTPAALRGYIDDAALLRLRQAGFSFVRLAVQPELAEAIDPLLDAVARIERHDLGVVVALFGTDWRLESSAADRDRFLAAWRKLAPRLRHFDPAMTFPELLNEPVFAGDADGWGRLQHQALTVVRAAMPRHTVVLTGADWGGLAGLLALRPEADRNVIYSFHFYEPAELTALGAYRADIDRAAMAGLPFPVRDPADCPTATVSQPTMALMQFYCAQRWDAGGVAERLAAAGDWALRHDTTVLLGEFGAAQLLNQPARLAWLTAVRAASEAQGIGWALWGYDDSMGFGQRPPNDRRPLDASLLRALTLPDGK